MYYSWHVYYHLIDNIENVIRRWIIFDWKAMTRIKNIILLFRQNLFDETLHRLRKK